MFVLRISYLTAMFSVIRIVCVNFDLVEGSTAKINGATNKSLAVYKLSQTSPPQHAVAGEFAQFHPQLSE